MSSEIHFIWSIFDVFREWLNVGSFWCHDWVCFCRYSTCVKYSICVTWLIHMCDMTHSYVWHNSFICVTWLIHVAWPIHMCDMTHSYVWHDSFICVTWLIHMCDMTHSYVVHDSFISVPWLIHMCGKTLSWVAWLIHMCDRTLWSQAKPLSSSLWQRQLYHSNVTLWYFETIRRPRMLRQELMSMMNKNNMSMKPLMYTWQNVRGNSRLRFSQDITLIL